MDPDSPVLEKKSLKQVIFEKITSTESGILPKDLVDLLGQRSSYIQAYVSRLRGEGHNIVLCNGKYVYKGSKAPRKKKTYQKHPMVIQKNNTIEQEISTLKEKKSILFNYDQTKINQFLNSLTESQRADIEIVIKKATQTCMLVNEYASFIKFRNSLQL